MLVEGDGRDVSGDAVGEKRNRINVDPDALQQSSAQIKAANQGAGAWDGGTGQGDPSQIQAWSGTFFLPGLW